MDVDLLQVCRDLSKKTSFGSSGTFLGSMSFGTCLVSWTYLWNPLGEYNMRRNKHSTERGLDMNQGTWKVHLRVFGCRACRGIPMVF